MYHFLYKTTNTITGKIYIGAHSTANLNDDYFGSGKQIKDAIKKYGKQVFIREILDHFDTRDEAFAQESKIVTEDFIKESNNYNMCPGGLGATIKTTDYRQKVSAKLKGRKFSDEHSKNKSLAQTGSKNHRYGKPNPDNPKLSGKDNGMYNKKHTKESLELMRTNRKNVKVELTPELSKQLSNACKGKLWYNNGSVSKRYYEGEQPINFVKGRK
jgi:hypothetical protein